MQSEMMLDINPTDPLNIAGFSHRIIDLTPGPPDIDGSHIDVFYTRDGGEIWEVTAIGNRIMAIRC
jgi:hypothetical protein